MMNDILVGKDTIDLVVDVNGCRVFAIVFRFCGFFALVWCVAIVFVLRLPGYWSLKKRLPRRLVVAKDERGSCGLWDRML